MTDELKRVPLVFYASTSGAEPVRDWLLALPAADRRKIGEGLKTLEFDWPIGMPLCRPLGRGLHELRAALESGRIARVVFCVRHDRLVALHGFIKKTRKTPQADLDIARRRKRRIERTK